MDFLPLSRIILLFFKLLIIKYKYICFYYFFFNFYMCLRIVGVAGLDVGGGPDGGTSVLQVEVGKQGDKLEGQGRGVVQQSRVVHGQKVPVVGVVKVRGLSFHAGQHGIGSEAGDLRVLAEDLVGDVKDDGVLHHLLEDTALAQQVPDQPTVVVVNLVVSFMFLNPKHQENLFSLYCPLSLSLSLLT